MWSNASQSLPWKGRKPPKKSETGKAQRHSKAISLNEESTNAMDCQNRSSMDSLQNGGAHSKLSLMIPHLVFTEMIGYNTHHFVRFFPYKKSTRIQRRVCLFVCMNLCIDITSHPHKLYPNKPRHTQTILAKFRVPCPGTTLKHWLRISKLVCTVSGQRRAKAGQGNVIE